MQFHFKESAISPTKTNYLASRKIADSVNLIKVGTNYGLLLYSKAFGTIEFPGIYVLYMHYRQTLYNGKLHAIGRLPN